MDRPVETHVPQHRTLTIADLVWCGILLLLCTGIWLTASGLWDADSWQRPPHYSGDSLFILAQMRAFATGEIHPVVQKFVPSLNAPFEADWNDFPVTEEPLYWGLGLIARVLGLTAAAHLAVLFAQLLAALSFFATCRLLRYDRVWSLCGALVFSFSSYLWIRGFAHLTLTYCWHLPLCILVTWWCGSASRLRSSSYKLWISLGVAVVTGVQNPYYLNIFLQFLALAALSQVLRKRWRHVVPVLAVGLVSVLGFLLMNADTLSYGWQHGKNEGVVIRPFSAYEQLSLLPTRMLLPQKHRWQTLDELARERYNSKLKFHTKEQEGTYLGVIGISALLWLFLFSFRHILLGQGQRVPIHAWQALWVLLYAMAGGGNWMLAVFFKIDLFRGGNRYSIVILVLALLFLVRELSWRIRWRWYYVPLALLLVVFGLWDSMTPRTPLARQAQEAGLEKVASDRDFVAKAEALLPEDAMLFDFPVCGYPEAGIFGRLCYDYLRPYLHSDSLRFSFGTHKGRLRDYWQRDLDALPLPNAVRVLERLGFAGILVHTDFLEDEGQGLLERLEAIDRHAILASETSGLVLVRLDPHADDKPLVVSLGHGWHRELPKETLVWQRHRVHWSRGRSEMIVVNGGEEPLRSVLRFRLVARRQSQRVRISIGGEVVRDLTVSPDSRLEVEPLVVDARPGETRIWLEAEGSGPDRRPALPFGIVGLEILPRKTTGSGEDSSKAETQTGTSSHQVVSLEYLAQSFPEPLRSELLDGI